MTNRQRRLNDLAILIVKISSELEYVQAEFDEISKMSDEEFEASGNDGDDD